MYPRYIHALSTKCSLCQERQNSEGGVKRALMGNFHGVLRFEGRFAADLNIQRMSGACPVWV